MKKLTRMMLSAAIAATLTAPALAAENSYPADTKTARAVVGPSLHQWKALATAEADVLAKKLGTESGPWQVKLAAGGDSRFAQSFGTMLTSELSARGVKLTTQASDAAIEVQAETLRHAVDKRRYWPGSLSALTAGVWLVKGLADVASGPVVATALAVGSDAALTYWKDQSDIAGGELGITLVATKAGILTSSSTNVYLLNHQGDDAYPGQSGRTLKFVK